jgi:hypothetical protein
MSTAPAHKPIVHFVGSIPLPDAETVFRTLAAANRTTPEAPAGRRDRHPQDLDLLSAASAGG